MTGKKVETPSGSNRDGALDKGTAEAPYNHNVTTTLPKIKGSVGCPGGRSVDREGNVMTTIKKPTFPVPGHELALQLQMYRRELIPLHEDLHVQRLLGAVLLIMNEEVRSCVKV